MRDAKSDFIFYMEWCDILWKQYACLKGNSLKLLASNSLVVAHVIFQYDVRFMGNCLR